MSSTTNVLHVSIFCYKHLQVVDYDTMPSDVLNFDIVVSDGLFTDRATIQITVTDVNDNAPSFLPESREQNFTISEGEPVGYVVTTVTAEDVDEGENGAFEYEEY